MKASQRWDARGYDAPDRDKLYGLISRAKYLLGRESMAVATDPQLAAVLGVSVPTLVRWKRDPHKLPYWAFMAITSLSEE